MKEIESHETLPQTTWTEKKNKIFKRYSSQRSAEKSNRAWLLFTHIGFCFTSGTTCSHPRLKNKNLRRADNSYKLIYTPKLDKEPSGHKKRAERGTG